MSQGVSIHSCVSFLADVLGSVRRATDISISRDFMQRFTRRHFPALLAYLDLEYGTINLEAPASHFQQSTNLDLGWFSRAITFYKVIFVIT